MLLTNTPDRVVHSSLELKSTLLLNVMPSHTIALALGNSRMSKRKKGSFCGLDLLERPPWSMLLLEAMLTCGLCYSQRSCGCQWSTLPLEETIASLLSMLLPAVRTRKLLCCGIDDWRLTVENERY